MPADTVSSTAKPLFWIDLLNLESEWLEPKTDLKVFLGEFLRKFMEAAPSSSHDIDDKDLEIFLERLSFMRKSIHQIHFGQELNLEPINTQLSQIRPVLSIDSRTIQTSNETYRLPILQAQAQGNSVRDCIQALSDTLFLQYIYFVNESLESNSKSIITRCEGLFREETAERLTITKSISLEDEKLFRQEIAQLAEADLIGEASIQRCADLFYMRPKAKFCSDACRFSTFQITKQLTQPDYLKEKQRRYRLRKP